MRDFSRRKGVYTARLEEFEVALLESLVEIDRVVKARPFLENDFAC